MAEFVPVSELQKAIETAISGRKTGAFFITSSSQHSALITLKSGQITGVKYRNTRGYDAARTIADLKSVRYQTAAEPTELPGGETLDTQAVLDIFRGLDDLESLEGGDEGEASAGGESSVSTEQLDTMREKYIAAIGPIGGALFDEELEAVGKAAHSRTGYSQLAQVLAEQIDDESEKRKFIDAVRLS